MSSLQQKWRKGQNRFYLEAKQGEREEEAGGRNRPNKYAHVNK
jgi:hypothetical protein